MLVESLVRRKTGLSEPLQQCLVEEPHGVCGLAYLLIESCLLPEVAIGRVGELPSGSPMRTQLVAASVLLALAAPAGVNAVTLDQACQKFATKLSAAQASGNKAQAQTVYAEGSKRIASRFNGATCPNVKAPAP